LSSGKKIDEPVECEGGNPPIVVVENAHNIFVKKGDVPGLFKPDVH
jgi:hypothetical protein